jgi:hypothetical protein
MGNPMTKHAYIEMLEEDIDWLETCTNHSIEKMHILTLLREEKAKSESSRSASCSIAIEANERLIAIYEAEAVESAMHLMRKLNRGQISKIRLLDPNLADHYAESLSN